MNSDNATPKIDWIEVSREAHELGMRHGRGAHIFAEKLAESADRAGEPEPAVFWRAVSASLKPRGADAEP